jgi:hypothetical protein
MEKIFGIFVIIILWIGIIAAGTCIRLLIHLPEIVYFIISLVLAYVGIENTMHVWRKTKNEN